MLKDILYYYNQGILKILLFTLLVLLPFQIFVYGWIYYVQQLGLEKIENILVLFLYILMFISTQRPFNKLYEHIKRSDEYRIKSMVRDFAVSFGMVFVGGIFVFVCAYVGMIFFIVPGVIILTFSFLLPFYQEEFLSVKELFSKAVRFYKRRYLSIYADLLLWASVNVLIWVLFLKGMAAFEMNLLTYTVLRILLNLVLFPFIYFYLYEKYSSGDAYES